MSFQFFSGGLQVGGAHGHRDVGALWSEREERRVGRNGQGAPSLLLPPELGFSRLTSLGI